MPGPIQTLEWEGIALTWWAWTCELLETTEQEIRRKAAAYLARRVDILVIADRARKEIIRGLTDPLLAELGDEL